MQAALATFGQKELPVRNASELDLFLEENLAALESFEDGDRHKIALVTELFSVYDSSRVTARKAEISNTFVPKIVSSPEFFTKIFAAIFAPDSKLVGPLLKLVYEGLFSVLPSSSTLVANYVRELSKNYTSMSASDQALAVIVAIQFVTTNPDPDSYLFDAPCVREVDAAVPQCPAPVGLCWGLVLWKLANSGNENVPLTALSVRSLEELSLKSRDILATALDHHAISHIIDIMAQLPQDIQYAHTMSNLLQPLSCVAQMSQALASAITIVLEPYPLVARAFWNDQTMQVLELTKAKLPASLPTFISLARAYPEPLTLLESLSTYMDFVDPVNLKEQDESVILADDTQFFPPRPTDNQGAVVLSKGTAGTVINQSTMGSLVMWNIEYNGWSLIGRIVENAVCNKCWDETAIAALYLINRTLASLDEREQVTRLNSMLSASLAQGDFIDLLNRQFEVLLSYDYEQLNIVMLILHFYLQLAKLSPERVWMLFRYSSLLEHNGEGGYMTSIVGAVEVFKNDYSFTLRLLDLIKVITPSYTEDFKPVMDQLLRHTIDVFESFTFWSYQDISQRQAIMHSIIQTLRHCQNHDSVLHAFLSESKTRLTEPFIAVLEYEDDALITDVLEFAASLVNLRSKCKKSYSYLERSLYANSPKLVELFDQRRPGLKVVIAKVFEALVGAKGQEQPSLLAYLGTENSHLLLKNLNRCVTDDLGTDEVLVSVCRFFSSVISSKQQGLSVLLLSGKDLRESKNSESLFDAIQDKIIKSHELLSYEALSALLDALSAPPKVETYKTELIPVLIEFIKEGLETPFDESVSTCYFIYSVGKAMSILSRAFFHKKDISAFVSVLSDKKTFERYLSKFFRVSDYNFDLHSAISKHVHQGLLKSVRVNDPFSKQDLPCYNDQFVYESENAEIKRANINLCFVHAQTSLVKSWAQLCTTLAIQADKSLDLELVALEALRSNTYEELVTPFFVSVIEERIGVCFFVLHTMSGRKSIKLSSEIVSYAVSLLCNDSIGMGACACDPSKPKVYKTLLRVLDLQLELAVGTPKALPGNVVLEIVKSVIICQVSQVALEAAVAPMEAAEDLQCFVIILRHCLAILKPDTETQAALSILMMDNNFSQSISKLYSGKLEQDTNHPVIAKLALFYILEWLQAKDMGWFFMSSGIVQNLLDAPLSEFIQKGDITPLDTPYVHQIWTKGLLHIFLILLNQLGERAEVATQLFAQKFRPQMQTCFQQWISKTGKISLDLIEETLLTVAFLRTIPKKHDTTFESQEELTQAIEHLSSHRKYLATRMRSLQGEPDVDTIIKEMSDLQKIIS